MLCFKALPSSALGASSKSIAATAANSLDNAMQQLFSSNDSVRAQAVVASGRYTIWRDPNAKRVGRQQDPTQGIPLNYNSCFLSCDEDSE
jgi:hypothetical protein